MPQATVDAFISQLDSLGLDELRRVNDALQERLKSAPQAEKRTEKSEEEKQADFHQALLSAGLIKRIKPPRTAENAERPIFDIQGEPLSETIIQERR